MFLVYRAANPDEPSVLELMGIFSTEALAVAACTNRRDCVLGPFVLDQVLPDEVFYPEISYFPNPPDGYEREVVFAK